MTWLIAFIVMLLVVAGMAIGVMVGRKPIAGSCGGIANLGIEKVCGICGNDFNKCTNKQDGDTTGIEQTTELSRPR
ncbi:MAG: (Na+)-NQR maturation NqrM [Lautropia sp.]|nr:(Na+)-NQR maturation NqrM [Lautropia sp.]